MIKIAFFDIPGVDGNHHTIAMYIEIREIKGGKEEEEEEGRISSISSSHLITTTTTTSAWGGGWGGDGALITASWRQHGHQ